jgi:serine/threonine-protein kinase
MVFASVSVACGGDGDDPPTGPATGAPGPFFSQAMFFNQDVSGVAPSPTSGTQIASLRAAGGWGNGDRMQIDFSIDVLLADSSTPKRTFEPTGDFYEPDCDQVEIPVPTGGNVEGESGYACESDGDCHLLVFDADAAATMCARTSAARSSGCLAVWDTKIAT